MVLNYFVIVVVYDIGEVEMFVGLLFYIVMEYVDGVILCDIVYIEGLMMFKCVIEVIVDVC